MAQKLIDQIPELFAKAGLGKTQKINPIKKGVVNPAFEVIIGVKKI